MARPGRRKPGEVSGVGQTGRVYVELSRLSNIPTCLTNALVGCALGGAIPWRTAAIVTVGVMLMYVAGMALNDAFDAEVDARRRPERPIPSGRLPRRAAFVYGMVCLALGVAVTAAVGPVLFALALAVCIVLYNLLHHRLAIAVVFMGLCRGLIYPLAAGAVSQAPDWNLVAWFAAAMGAYVTVLTIIARREAADTASVGRWLSLFLPAIALLPVIRIRPESWTWTSLGGVVMVAWLLRSARCALGRPPRIKRAVLGWLSGICLIDACYLALLDQPTAAIAALGCFGLTVVGHRYILGT